MTSLYPASQVGKRPRRNPWHQALLITLPLGTLSLVLNVMAFTARGRSRLLLATGRQMEVRL